MPQGKTKRLHWTPLILGAYAMLLGLGLVMIGLAGLVSDATGLASGAVGVMRLVLGLVMAGVGAYGVWDGVRDLVRPEETAEKAPTTQFILTDVSGKKSSHVTPEFLREQIDRLVTSETYKTFDLQILPPLSVSDYGLLKQIICVYHDAIILVAFLAVPQDGWRIYQKNAAPDTAQAWLEQLLAGSVDFSGWKNVETTDRQDDEMAALNETDTSLRETEKSSVWQQVLTKREGVPTFWQKRLVIFGEDWHDEHPFFSDEDIALAVEGVHTGQYQKIFLEWGGYVFYIFSGRQNELLVIWQINVSQKNTPHFLAREGTVTQVNFWLNRYLSEEPTHLNGWTDITDQIIKGVKKHGKLF